MSTVWHWPGSTITRVIDGDTVVATVTRDIGFGATIAFPVKLRLAGINCDARGTPIGFAAAALVEQLTAGVTVSIDTFKTYKYGGGTMPEWMAAITLSDGQDVAGILLAHGYAAPWDGEGKPPIPTGKPPVP